MDLSYSPEEERFRAELRDWLGANPPGPEPEALDEWVEYGKSWQRRLHEAGWCGVHWPVAEVADLSSGHDRVTSLHAAYRLWLFA